MVSATSDLYTKFESIANDIRNATLANFQSLYNKAVNNLSLVTRAEREGSQTYYKTQAEKDLTNLEHKHQELQKDDSDNQQVNDIINKISTRQMIAPTWFVDNNVNWVLQGELSQNEFLTTYHNLVDTGIIHAPIPEPTFVTVTPESTSWYWIKKPSGQIEYVKISEKFKQVYLDKGYIVSRSKIEAVPPPPEPTPPPEPQPTPEPVPVETPLVTKPEPVIIQEPIVTATPIITPTVDDSINTGMVTQQVINFNIVNGRAVGSIKFVATNSFNSYYYNKDIINLVQFKTPNGVTLLVKENRLRFTQTERDEVINFDENVQENTRITVESFVWEWIDKPAGAFSNKYSIEISEAEPPKPLQMGFMGAGAMGIIGLLILGGVVAEKVKK